MLNYPNEINLPSAETRAPSGENVFTDKNVIRSQFELRNLLAITYGP